MSALLFISRACATVFTLGTLVLVGSTHIASASAVSSGGLGSSINDYVHSRLCERFAQLRTSRPYLPLPRFCGDYPLRPIVDISASPSALTAGQAAVLTWVSSNATSCTATGAWTGSKIPTGSESVSPVTSATYTLTCTNAAGSTSDSVTVIVSPVPQQPGLALSANPMSILQGSTTLVTWSSVGTTGCVASGGWTGAKPTAGSQTFSPATTTDYGITCAGAGGTISGTTTVMVVPAAMPTLTIGAVPASISQGATSTITWNSTNASSCSASNGWSGAKALFGNTVVSPVTTTTYVLTCQGIGGHVHATTTIVVTSLPVPTVTLVSTPGVIVNGATTTLSWGSAHADTCNATRGWSGAKVLAGSQVISPATTTVFVLNCSGPGGGAAATTTVVVTAAPLPTLTFSANPATTTATSTLAWNTANATSCIASLGWGGSPGLSGALIVTPSTTTVYVLDCYGLGGSVQATTTVHVATSTVATASVFQEASLQPFAAASFQDLDSSDSAADDNVVEESEERRSVIRETTPRAGKLIERLRSTLLQGGHR